MLLKSLAFQFLCKFIMSAPSTIGLFFIALAVVYFVAAVRNYFQSRGMPTPARYAWLRIAFIFASIGVSLCILPALWGR